ncbi:MAG: 2-C-methyl-D-erythritol 2,4-cyclodiphosphate synthase [Acidimicrobiia bacterium]|nr:2-C-methyl-D-erythritol 2,4-cyclodiphosphate synthase [Acidimicrobiia bacterium]MCL4291882.1 2-C-methyl-D-erythritol 2,4-cyclodiphosphate synthase [Acidimicrobiia bacterium]
MTNRVGLGFDVHPFGDDGRDLVIGGVTIDGPGLVGHSDADVVAHAAADALLGAAGLGDLGSLFPAGEEATRGASSIALLGDVARRVATAGWWVVNIDVVVAAERPHLAPHLAAMVENLARAVHPAAEPLGTGVHVSVKPKRAEGLGAIGRAEGIAAWAVALLEAG